jgi:hypothetical protein
VRGAGSRSINVLGLALTLTGSTAFGADQLDIRIYNDTADELVVTVYDVNAGSPRPVLARQVIDGFAWLTTSVTPSIGSDSHVRWIAETIGTVFRRCGYGESGGLRTNAMVKVFTDSRCEKISLDRDQGNSAAIMTMPTRRQASAPVLIASVFRATPPHGGFRPYVSLQRI